MYGTVSFNNAKYCEYCELWRHEATIAWPAPLLSLSTRCSQEADDHSVPALQREAVLPEALPRRYCKPCRCQRQLCSVFLEMFVLTLPCIYVSFPCNTNVIRSVLFLCLFFLNVLLNSFRLGLEMNLIFFASHYTFFWVLTWFEVFWVPKCLKTGTKLNI